jgi:hypothetical protein
MMFNNTNLIIRVVISILTFITSGFMVFLIIRYVIFTTYAIEHLNDSIQLVLSRGHSSPLAAVVNTISRVGSINSMDIALEAIESGTIHTITSGSISPVPSSNIIHNAITPIPNIRISTTSSLLNHPFGGFDSINTPEGGVNTSIDIVFNRRIVIAAVIGFGVFIGINTSVNIYLFVAVPCC